MKKVTQILASVARGDATDIDRASSLKKEFVLHGTALQSRLTIAPLISESRLSIANFV